MLQIEGREYSWRDVLGAAWLLAWVWPVVAHALLERVAPAACWRRCRGGEADVGTKTQCLEQLAAECADLLDGDWSQECSVSSPDGQDHQVVVRQELRKDDGRVNVVRWTCGIVADGADSWWLGGDRTVLIQRWRAGELVTEMQGVGQPCDEALADAMFEVEQLLGEIEA